MDFYHTGVPESQRGKGVAAHLVKVSTTQIVWQIIKNKNVHWGLIGWIKLQFSHNDRVRTVL
jgi:hypothetical protein